MRTIICGTWRQLTRSPWPAWRMATEDLANIHGLTSLACSIDAVVVRPWHARMRALAALGGRTPCSVAYFNEHELHERVARRMRHEHFDAILVNSSQMAQFVEPYADLPRIMQFVDLDSLKWRQYAENSRLPRSWIFRRESRCLMEYERKLARTFRTLWSALRASFQICSGWSRAWRQAASATASISSFSDLSRS